MEVEKKRLDLEKKRKDEQELNSLAESELLPELENLDGEDPEAYLDVELNKELEAISEYSTLLASEKTQKSKQQHTMESWTD